MQFTYSLTTSRLHTAKT